MTLGYSKVFHKSLKDIGGLRTYFKEKILSGLYHYVEQLDPLEPISHVKVNEISRYKDFVIKAHTIREDSKRRWKVGNKIHFVYGNRTKNREQFTPVIGVKSVQTISITHGEPDGNRFPPPKVFVDKRQLSQYEINRLAVNDGFEDAKDFFSWFEDDFTGVIIHWTDIKY